MGTGRILGGFSALRSWAFCWESISLVGDHGGGWPGSCQGDHSITGSCYAMAGKGGVWNRKGAKLMYLRVLMPNIVVKKKTTTEILL